MSLVQIAAIAFSERDRLLDAVVVALLALFVITSAVASLFLAPLEALPGDVAGLVSPLPGSLSAQGYAFPVGGRYSYRDDWGEPRYTPSFHLHEGTDIFAPYGTPVYATIDGAIEKIGTKGAGGNTIGLRGKDGRYYYYAHLSAWAIGLESGVQVKAGQIIGYVGDSGNARGGAPHLHFGIREGNAWVNPYPFLRAL